MYWIKRVAWLVLWFGMIGRLQAAEDVNLQADKAMLLEFCANWCGPCQAMAPTVESLAQAGYAVRRIDIDRQPDLARQYGVGAIPCFVVVEQGREIDRVTGMTTMERLTIKLPRKPRPAWRCERPVGHYAAVVRIRCELANNQRALGSGVLVRWGGRIVVLTARHVVRDAKKIVVRLVTEKEYPARVLVASAWDCAVLQLEGDPAGVEPAKMALGAAAVFHAGDRLTSCGYGGAEARLAANSGLFIGYRRGAVGGDGHDDWFELSGPARPGDSGGPIFDRRGRVVGIVWGTDGTTVIGVQAGRLHVELEEARKYYKPLAASEAAASQLGETASGRCDDLRLVPVVFPPEIERHPTPPMTAEGVGPLPYESSRGVDVKVGGGKRPVLPWRADELKRDTAMEAKIRAQQAEIDGLVELEHARRNQPPLAPALPIAPPAAKPSDSGASPLVAGIVLLGASVIGGFFCAKTKKRS